MESKYSPQVQAEINEIKKFIEKYHNLFSLKIEYYIDGLAIFLREKNLYPRLIVIFRSSLSEVFSIKSFEIHTNEFLKEDYRELYSKEDCKDIYKLLKELREIIYGKDIINFTSNKYHNYFIK